MNSNSLSTKAAESSTATPTPQMVEEALAYLEAETTRTQAAEVATLEALLQAHSRELALAAGLGGMAGAAIAAVLFAFLG